MKPHIFLRIASVLALFMSIAHTIGGVFGEPMPGAASDAVAAMKANHFLLSGNDRSYWVFFIGFGLSMTISLVVEAIVFWLLGSLAKTEAARLRPILLVFFLGYVGQMVLSYMCFFPPPVVGGLLIASCLLGAFITAKRVPA